jgi:hypothetical protein
VTDDDSANAYDTVKITVSPALNMLPVADAGNEKSITLPEDSIRLYGSPMDPDGHNRNKMGVH